jgi:hypothetical protein
VVIISTDKLSAQNINPEYIIPKEKGRIILAYKVFEEFLNSDKSWDNTGKLYLGPVPKCRQYMIRH